MVTAMDSSTRHWRFLRNGEFDMAELSSSSYLIARDQGHPIHAIPVFLHRRFRHGFAFINTAKGIAKPADLIGRKVGVKSYQVSAILWLRGILEEHYGVPHKSIEWFSEIDEDVAFTPPADLKLTRLPPDKSVEAMLAEGELDAILHPDLIQPMIDGDPRVGAAVPGLQGGGDRLLPQDRHLPDHARHGDPAGTGRAKSLAADQHVQRLQSSQGGGDEAHAEPAPRAAGLVSRGLGGTGRHPRRRPVGIRHERAQHRATSKRWSAIRTTRA